MLGDLSFCDRERALLSVIIKTVLTFAVVKKGKGILIFQHFCSLGIRKKMRKSNLHLVLLIILALEYKGL